MDLCAVSRWCEGYRNKGKAQSSSVLDRISGSITPTFQTLSRPEIIRVSTIENEKLPYISTTYGGESVSQSPLKDQAFSTFLDQNPPFELRPKMGFAFRQWPSTSTTGKDWRTPETLHLPAKSEGVCSRPKRPSNPPCSLPQTDGSRGPRVHRRADGRPSNICR
jgi:hypothetical protein